MLTHIIPTPNEEDWSDHMKFWFKYDLIRTEVPSTPSDPTRVQTHDLQIMTVHFMSLRCLLYTTWPSLTSFKKWNVLPHYLRTRLTAHVMCGMTFDLEIFKLRKILVIYDTECSYWDQVSLNNPKIFCVFTDIFLFMRKSPQSNFLMWLMGLILFHVAQGKETR